MQSHPLPRLLYLGDVPVEATVAGSALLYRLLQNYPVDRLCIVESNLLKSNPEQRLAEVAYHSLPLAAKRLQQSRFVRWYCSYLLMTAQSQPASLTRTIAAFQPDAILTVTHGFTWLTAAALAAQRQLPLHLILHDEWLAHLPILPMLQTIAKKRFAAAYRQASSRLCVSPYMAEIYQQQFGVVGSVLYPSRSRDAISFEHPSDRVASNHSPLVFAYAGSVNSPAYANSLATLAAVLKETGDQLVIYSPLTKTDSQKLGFDQPHVTTHALIPSHTLIHTLRAQADVLFVPMSFEAADRANMEMSFPSKLTDYTAMGLPLLVWGPPYCSAVRWAKDYAGVAEVVDQQEPAALRNSVQRLKESADYRLQLATWALKRGAEFFSHSQGVQTFYQALTQMDDRHLHTYAAV